MNVGTDKTVSFSTDSTSESSAVYVAGRSGAGDTGSGFLAKLDDLASADPNESFREVINTVGAADDANGVAVDSLGNVYVVETTAGDLDGQVNTGGNDVYLTKFDAAGNEIYTRLLGSAEDASGFAVAVDSGDNVIVAGQVSGTLTDIAFGGGYDSFMTKFDSKGQETFTRQVAPFASDGAISLAVDFKRQHYPRRLHQRRDRCLADLRRLERRLHDQARQRRNPHRQPAVRRFRLRGGDRRHRERRG